MEREEDHCEDTPQTGGKGAWVCEEVLGTKVPFSSREKEGVVWELRGSGRVTTEESMERLAPSSKL